MRHRTTWACCGSTWRRMAGWWTSTRIAIRCSPCRRRPGESNEQQREADRLTQLGRALRELGIGSILAYSPQAKGRIERSFLTAQDRLVKQLRLAKVSTLEARQCVSGERVLAGVECAFRPAGGGLPQSASSADAAHLDLAAILCHVERAGDRQRLHLLFRRPPLSDSCDSRCKRGCGARRLRVELRLDGELKARYQGRYVAIGECGVRPVVAEPKATQTGSQRSQRGRQEPLDGRLLRSTCSAIVEVRSETEKSKPIWKTRLFSMPKASALGVSPKQWIRG